MGALGRMGIVAGMHVAVIFLIARSLGIVPPLLQPDDIKIIQVDHPVIDEDPAPVVGPRLQDPPIIVPIPEDPPIESPPQKDVIGAVGERDPIPVIEGSGTPDIPGLVISARPDARHPLSQPRYPSWDTRDGNQGNVDVEVYVLSDGRVGDARIVRSSGFERLDQSTIDEAKRNWRLLPATRDGVPFAQWCRIRVTFKLTNK